MNKHREDAREKARAQLRRDPGPQRPCVHDTQPGHWCPGCFNANVERLNRMMLEACSDWRLEEKS